MFPDQEGQFYDICCRRVRDLRNENDLTQEQVATKLGICRKTYSDYECGHTRFPVYHLRELAWYFNVSMDYLTGINSIIAPCRPDEGMFESLGPRIPGRVRPVKDDPYSGFYGRRTAEDRKPFPEEKE